MRWLVDGYNVIRRSPELASREQESLEAGRQALCRLLACAARASGDHFTVVFDGARGGGGAGGASVSVIFSSARETADRVLARLAVGGGAAVSNDREVRQAAARAGAVVVSTDQFLERLERFVATDRVPAAGATDPVGDEDEDDTLRGPKKGNPRRLPKKARAAARALNRLRPPT